MVAAVLAAAVCTLTTPLDRQLRPVELVSAQEVVKPIEKIFIISIKDSGFNATKNRLLDAGVGEDFIEMWHGIDGNKQKVAHQANVTEFARNLGVLEPDEGCNSPPPSPTPPPEPPPLPPADPNVLPPNVLPSPSPTADADFSNASEAVPLPSPALAAATGVVTDTASVPGSNNTMLVRADEEVCSNLSSLAWHQFAISTSHASLWEYATQRDRDTWTVIMEEDAHFVKTGGEPDRNWFGLARDVLSEAPEDADFVWLSGQMDSLRPKEAMGNYTTGGPLFLQGTTFCPHAYAVNQNGALKLLAAAREQIIYKAVDIWLIEQLPYILTSYFVNDKRLVADGRMEPAPEESYPRNSGIAYQEWREDM